MENQYPFEGWRGFREGSWVNEIDLRSFIRHNFTMYDGDETFLEGPTQNTLDLWDQVMDLTRQEREAGGNFHMEQVALDRVLRHWTALGMEGIVLVDEGQPIAFAIGSRLTEDTFDIHFEKAMDTTDGSYAAINQAFAAYLMEKYPAVKWLNREDDLGIEGLRSAKLSYKPDRLVEKYWARFWEDDEDAD